MRLIRRSYRIRGSVPRIQINRIEIKMVERMVENSVNVFETVIVINKILVSNLITIMFAYSAIKIRANLPALYSTLNPDTSSDSPSAKSNGVRFVSARIEINQMKIRNGQRKRGQII